jgi:hypothetical protein
MHIYIFTLNAGELHCRSADVMMQQGQTGG